MVVGEEADEPAPFGARASWDVGEGESNESETGEVANSKEKTPRSVGAAAGAAAGAATGAWWVVESEESEVAGVEANEGASEVVDDEVEEGADR